MYARFNEGNKGYIGTVLYMLWMQNQLITLFMT